MEPYQAVELGRHALWIAVLISSPILLVGLVVCTVIGLLQALTQVQEQTITFVPKIVAMVLALGLTLPWVIQQMLQYSTDLIGCIASRM